MNPLVFLECKCSEQKKYRLIFDGGTSGNYSVEVCQKCWEQEDKKFITSSTKIF